MSHDNCLDCDAPLIPCTCSPDCPGGMCADCAIAEPYKRLRKELDEIIRIAQLRGREVAKWAFESGTAKGQRDRARKLAAFYKSCALSGEVPSAETIAEMEKEPT